MALTLLCAGIIAGGMGCGQKDETPAPTTPAPAAPTNAPPVAAAPEAGKDDAKPGATVKLPDGLEYTDVKIGTGTSPLDGQTAVVHYVGTLTDGKEFDSSIKRGTPFEFRLGGGQVIKGWDEGVRGMKVGGERKLKIPYELGYGKEGHPPDIPASATLLFTIQLLEVK